MSLTVGAILVTAAIATHAAAPGHPVLSRASIEHGLKKAKCPIPPKDAKVIGTEWLGKRLRIVEVSCRLDAGAGGSILFAVAVDRPARGRLIMVQDWKDGQLTSGYRVTSPGYDRETRTLNAVRKARPAGDCGTIKEWQWNGWFFRLINVWHKDACDGEVFEWDNRHGWQVFPARDRPPVSMVAR
jgi:hypothetical protein